MSNNIVAIVAVIRWIIVVAAIWQLTYIAVNLWRIYGKLILRPVKSRRRHIMSLMQIRHECRDHRVWVPGRRVRMRKATFFNLWMYTHREQIQRVHAVFGPATESDINDLGLTMYANFPEVVEHLKN